MNAEDFVRLVKVFLTAKGERLGPEPTHFWQHQVRKDNVYEEMIHASPDFSFIVASVPMRCVLRVEGGKIEHYAYDRTFAESMKSQVTLELLGDIAQ